LDLNIKGKVALVTGSSSGIGFGIAKFLAAEGALVILNGRDRSRLEVAAQNIAGSCWVAKNVTSPSCCEDLIESVISKYGRLDMLVCNVGSGSAKGDDRGEWDRLVSINLYSAVGMVAAAEKHLIASGGSIVCISSICGQEVQPCPVPYAAAKAALNAFVRNVSRQLGKSGVRINAIAPGNILFCGSVWARKIEEDPEGVSKFIADNVALNKFGAPEDVAALTAYLLSPLANFLTGNIYVVDGGQVRS